MKKEMILFLILISACTRTPTSFYEPASDIEVYFCPQDYCMEKIIELIDNSQEIKCAFFQLNLPELIEKLKEKNAEVVLEDKYAMDDFFSGYSSALMHNKFCVFDNEIVLTGSMNPTERGNYYNNNNIVIIESKFLAENYLSEFEELKNNEFGKGAKIEYPEIMLGETKIESYMCPEDNCKLRVINTLKQAEESIYFMIYSFTDEDIGNLLWNKNYLGLNVNGILEKKQVSKYSRYEDLKEFSIIDNNKYTFHHKVFIIDNKIVITGSYNPTKNANENNDENLIIIHDKEIAEKYLEEFHSQYAFKENMIKESEDLIIHKVVYDVPGADKGNEYVELKNTGDKKINLNYYFISNNKTNTRLNGSIKPREIKIVKPKFTMKNSKDLLLLKHNHNIIDYEIWN